MLKPSASLPKPCQRSPGLSIHASRAPRCPLPTGRPAPDPEPPIGAPFLVNLAHGAAEIRASAIDSSTRAVPPGSSIIAAATSQEAMIEYWGEVEVCIR